MGAVRVKAKFAKLSCGAQTQARFRKSDVSHSLHHPPLGIGPKETGVESNTERSWVRFRTWPSLSFKRVIFSYWNSIHNIID